MPEIYKKHLLGAYDEQTGKQSCLFCDLVMTHKRKTLTGYLYICENKDSLHCVQCSEEALPEGSIIINCI
jgi:hypothetical protein